MVTAVSPESTITKVHAAFAAAAEVTLDNGMVAGLTVTTDSSVSDIDLDLFSTTGFQATVNPQWALTLTQERLTSALQSVMFTELAA